MALNPTTPAQRRAVPGERCTCGRKRNEGRCPVYTLRPANVALAESDRRAEQ